MLELIKTKLFAKRIKRKVDQYLVIKGCAGMGNRIFAFLEGVVYAQLTGRKIIVDWRDWHYSSGGINAFHEYFTSPVVDPVLPMPESGSVYPRQWRGRQEASIYEIRNEFGSKSRDPMKRHYSIDISRTGYRHDVVFMWDYSFDIRYFKQALRRFPVAWPSQSQSALVRFLLQNYLCLKPDIRDEVTRFKKKYFRSRMIGVHIRNTDNNKYPHRGKSVKLENYGDVLRRILCDCPDAGIFLSTDNQDTEKTYKAKYPGVVTTKKYFAPDPSQGIHFSRGDVDKLKQGREALTDMVLLSECDYLVYSSRSSFGSVSYLLSTADSSHVIDVDPRPRRCLFGFN